MKKPLNIEVIDSETTRIEGVKYSNDLFQELGVEGMREGSLFTIIKREDGCVTVGILYGVEFAHA
jgi:hypothetical protein